MKTSLGNFLRHPVTKAPLTLSVITRLGEEIEEGALGSFRIINGIPRFVSGEDEEQMQTSGSFEYKWKRTDSYASESMKKEFSQWILERYGFSDKDEMRSYFAKHSRILDLGCGGGQTTSTWLSSDGRSQAAYELFCVDISGAIDVAKSRLSSMGSIHFIQADCLQLPFEDECFDLIFSEGVLHHTPSTERALKAAVRHLRVGGEIMFYIYRKKSPIREFTDDYIRESVAGMPPEAAWERLRPLTQLGEALASLKCEVDVPADVPDLGIKAGRHDVQRLIYWHFAKLFWNEAYTFEENLHVNFDWYHPRYAHRQTEDQVRKWCAEAGLTISHFNEQPSGFTVRAKKNLHE